MVSEHLDGFMAMAKIQIKLLKKAEKLTGPEKADKEREVLASLEGVYRSMTYIVLHPDEYRVPARIK